MYIYADDDLIDVTLGKGKSTSSSHGTSMNHFQEYLRRSRKRKFEDLRSEDIKASLLSKFSDYIYKYLAKVTKGNTHLGYISGIRAQLREKFPEEVEERVFVKRINLLNDSIIKHYTKPGEKVKEGAGMVSNSKLPTRKELQILIRYLLKNKMYDYRALAIISIIVGGRNCEV